MLILEKDDGPSWFSPKDGSFPSSALPPKKSNPHPPDFLANVYSKRPNLFSFKDPNFKELFESKSMDKAVLDSLVFKDSTPIGLKSSPNANIDYMLRDIMYDFLILDKLFTFSYSLVPLAKSELYDNMSAESPTLDLIFEIMSLAARTSLKASQTLTAAFVANRTAIRDAVLEKFEGHDTSKENLRGSPFDSKNLFGPIPDSLKEKLNAQHGERFMLRLPRPKPSPSNKRSLSLTAPPPKKTKPQFNQNIRFPSPQWSSSKPTPQWSTSNSIPPKPSENFRTGKGRGKTLPLTQYYKK